MAFKKTCTVVSRPRLPIRFLNSNPARSRTTQPTRNNHEDAAPTTSSKSSRPVSKPASAGSGATPRLSSPSTTSSLSCIPLLSDLQRRARSPNTLNVYGIPFTKTELAALDAAALYLSADVRGSAAADGGPTALRRHLLDELLLDAAVLKRTPLPVVEGAMALLELLREEPTAGGGGSGGQEELVAADDPALLSRYRWQLVVGADVGGVQYIPAVEELEVAKDGASFTLGTDLDFIFTGFSGPCKWLAPGHLSYNVRQVRLELRWPKAWRRATAWLTWRRRLGGAATTASLAGDEPDWAHSLPTCPTCREDPTAPACTIPLPFPTNELLAISCSSRVAAIRSRLTNGLILLLEVGTREHMRGGAASPEKTNSGTSAS